MMDNSINNGIIELLEHDTECKFKTNYDEIELTRSDLWNIEFLDIGDVANKMIQYRSSSIYLFNTENLYLKLIDRTDHYIDQVTGDMEDLVIGLKLTFYDSYLNAISELTAKSWIIEKYIKLTRFGLPRQQFILPDPMDKFSLPDSKLESRSEIYLNLKLSNFNYKLL